MPTPDGLYLITFSKKHLPRRFLWNGRRLALYREGEIIAYAILEKLPDTRLDRNQLPNRDALLSTPRLMNRALSLSLPLKKKRPSLPLDTQLLRTLPRLSGSDIDLLCRTVRTVRDDILWNLLRPDTGKPTHTIDQNYYSVIHGKYPWINSKNLEYFLRCEEHYHWHGSDY